MKITITGRKGKRTADRIASVLAADHCVVVFDKGGAPKRMKGVDVVIEVRK